MNVGTPRFYVDDISYLLSRGVAQNGEFDVMATDAGSYLMGTFTTGSEPELFDMNPLNKVTFDTSADTDGHVLITLDTQRSSVKNFLAILNHNLNSAAGKIRLFAGGAIGDVQGVDGADIDNPDLDWDGVTVTEVVNADTRTVGSDDKSFVVEPAADGSTIFTFDDTNYRYWGIQFEGATGGSGAATNETWGGTDFFCSCICLGQVYDMPHAPDMAVNRSIMFDGVDVLESIGGKRFGNMNNHGRIATSTSKSPFNTGSDNFDTYGGRIAYDLNFSYLASTDVMPNEYSAIQIVDSAVVEDIWNKTNGRHLPFIFSIDKSSEGTDAESEHIFARFAQNSLDMEQVAINTFNIGMRIEEEF